MDNLTHTIEILHELGQRESQQDIYGVAELGDGILKVAVVDGMGGVEDGDKAAKIVCDALLSDRSIEDSMALANQELRICIDLDYSHLKESHVPGAVGSVLAFDFNERTLSIGHLGDTRVYRIRGEKCELLTEDQVNARGAPIEDFGRDSISPILTEHELQSNDIILVCSDGFFEVFNEYIEESILSYVCRAENGAQFLSLMSKDLSDCFHDNATAVVIEVLAQEAIVSKTEAKPELLIPVKPAVAVLFTALVLSLVILSFLGGYLWGREQHTCISSFENNVPIEVSIHQEEILP